MDGFRRLIRRACILPIWLTVLIAAPCYALLIRVLSREASPALSMLAYQLSVYALVITITACMRVLPALARRVREGALLNRLRATPLGLLLLKDAAFRAWITVYLSLAWDLLVAAAKLIAGFAVRSAWLITLGAYYLFLAVLRAMIVRPIRARRARAAFVEGVRRYRDCGVALLAMNQILVSVVVQAVLARGGFNYPGPLIYLMAAYAFWAVVSATVRLVKFHREADPLLSAAKAVSLTAAMVSMLALQSALIARFGDGDVLFRRAMTGALGGAVCLVELAIAVYMIARGTRELRRYT